MFYYVLHTAYNATHFYFVYKIAAHTYTELWFDVDNIKIICVIIIIIERFAIGICFDQHSARWLQKKERKESDRNDENENILMCLNFFFCIFAKRIGNALYYFCYLS